MKLDIAHVLVDNITKEETLHVINDFVRSGRPHYIVTTYSEFVVFANRDADYLRVLNQADLSLPDGSGILWAAKYLSLKSTNRLAALLQLIYTGASLVFYPNFTRSPIKEKVSGSQLFWDIAKLAQQKNFSLALVGGTGGVAQKSEEILLQQFPGLKINLAISDEPFDESIVQKIAHSNSDILCIAYAPPMQEKWIANNLSKLNVKVTIGLGGTFDYIAGKRPYAPKWMISLGLEWLFRLATQPWRIGRMWNAIAVFISIIYKSKLKQIYGQN